MHLNIIHIYICSKNYDLSQISVQLIRDQIGPEEEDNDDNGSATRLALSLCPLECDRVLARTSPDDTFTLYASPPPLGRSKILFT